MDPIQTVGGVAGLKQIADALRAEGFPVDAIYLIKLVSVEGEVDWVIRVVTRGRSKDAILKIFELRRAGRIPLFGGRLRIDAIAPDHPEASRVIAYARRFGRPPVEIDTVLLDGMLVTFALVADFRDADAAAA
jgi:hypothetical protein